MRRKIKTGTKNNISVIFGRNLRAWRISRKLMIKQTAQALGVALSTWSQWETGRRFPTGYYMGLLSRYNVPIQRLFLQYPSYNGKSDFTKREIKVFDK